MIHTGGLVLRGAIGAARQRGAGAATDLLTEVTTAAQRIGVDCTDYEVVFGPGHVVRGAVDCAVVAEDYAAAVKVAGTMPRGAALPLSTRCRYLVDVAQAALRLGHTRVAETVLLMMGRVVLEWAAPRQLLRVLVGELMIRGRPSASLRGLAQRWSVVWVPRLS